jgi:hypothetical protein
MRSKFIRVIGCSFILCHGLANCKQQTPPHHTRKCMVMMFCLHFILYFPPRSTFLTMENCSVLLKHKIKLLLTKALASTNVDAVWLLVCLVLTIPVVYTMCIGFGHFISFVSFVQLDHRHHHRYPNN